MKFGVREICDVTFKTTAAGQKVGATTFAKAGMPAFAIDTATTSSLEQATTTVYAMGGKGYNRLIAWEGEKTMTFTVEDALISPMGLAVLSGAGLVKPTSTELSHVHVTYDVTVVENAGGTAGVATITLSNLQDETGLYEATSFEVDASATAAAYATVIDGSGSGIEFVPDVTIGGTTSVVNTDAITVIDGEGVTFEVALELVGKVIKVDFYTLMSTGVSEITIEPSDFGGFFYVEAQTLYRREDTGMDMAAEIILPRVKVQSGFTFTMAATGDPSTFTFVMDAFPAYTRFNKTKKVMCVMQVIGSDE